MNFEIWFQKLRIKDHFRPFLELHNPVVFAQSVGDLTSAACNARIHTHEDREKENTEAFLLKLF